MKKILIVLGIILVFIMAVVYLMTRQKETQKTSEVVLYTSETCPHCKNVEAFISKNPSIEKKLGLIKKEVTEDVANKKDLVTKAGICKIDAETIGVPLLYFKGECISGDTPIIEFLSKKIVYAY